MMSKIRMELARNPGFPDGSSTHGYTLVAPLDATGKLDLDAWKTHRERCRVSRFWGTEAHQIGHLVHGQTGWRFHWDIKGDEDEDATGFRFDTEHFVPGEYISVVDPDGETMAFRVTSVEGVPALD